MTHDTFGAGDITAVIGDNSASGIHRAGYNGLWSLTHKNDPINLFVPAVAGLNFEHIFDGETIDPPGKSDLFFEPRRAEMTFKKRSPTSAELHQPPTPTFKLESWTTFDLKPPHYVDFEFRFRAAQHVFKRGYLGLFWASYMNAPDDKSIYFRGKTGWQQHCTPTHNTLSTVLHEDDRFEPTFHKDHRDCLYKSFSPLRFSQPFYYGHVRNMTVILMFDRTGGIRFAHSPSGGGFDRDRDTSNPAWDFQFLLPKYEVNTNYRFRGRLAYRPRCDRSEVLKEVEAFRTAKHD